MLIKDEGCISEQTILKYQTNNISDLMGCGWYGIMLYSPSGSLFVDTCYDVKKIGSERVVEFARKKIDEEFFMEGESRCFNENGESLYVYPIRKNDRGYYIFFSFYRNDEPFHEKDIRWYETYAKTAYQRVLLENELFQDRSLLEIFLGTTVNLVSVFSPDLAILAGNDRSKALFGSSLSEKGNLQNERKVMRAIREVFDTGEEREIILETCVENEKCIRAELKPLSTSKGIRGAVVLIGTVN